MSIVELLVGVAVGLVLATWAIALFVNTLGNNRKLDAEQRLNQSLGIAADLIARDLRRAGYWGDAIAGTVTSGSTTTANPYSTVSANVDTSTIDYGYATDADDAESSDEQYGFKLDGGVIKMKVSGNWENVTDPNVLTVTAMTITPTVTSVDLSGACSSTCTGGACPTLSIRAYSIALSGHYASDSSITRNLTSNVRLRNDGVSGACPA